MLCHLCSKRKHTVSLLKKSTITLTLHAKHHIRCKTLKIEHKCSLRTTVYSACMKVFSHFYISCITLIFAPENQLSKHGTKPQVDNRAYRQIYRLITFKNIFSSKNQRKEDARYKFYDKITHIPIE